MLIQENDWPSEVQDIFFFPQILLIWKCFICLININSKCPCSLYSWHVYIWMCVSASWLREWGLLISGSMMTQTTSAEDAWICEIRSLLHFLRSEGWRIASICIVMCGVLDMGVCVRSEVPCCVLWYLGSGSSVRPSGSLRSRRSEACNYWSPPGPLWGRYGSSDACCSCADAQESFF